MSGHRPSTILMAIAPEGGFWTYAVDLARGLQPHRVSIALAAIGTPLTAFQRAEAAQLPNLHLFQSGIRVSGFPRTGNAVDRAGEWLLKLESQIRPDVIHLTEGLHCALPWNAPVLLAGHACASTETAGLSGRAVSPEHLAYTERTRRGIHAAEMVVAPTKIALEALERRFGRVRASQIVPTGRPALVDPPNRKEPFIFSVGSFRALGLNLHVLTTAAAAGLPWPVFVAGELGDPERLPRVPTPGVAHCGWMSPEAIGQWTRAASIFCLPALFDPFGSAALDAALTGSALVLGDTPHLRELWGGAALFAPPGDASALRHALRVLAKDRPLREAYGRSARARALRYPLERMAEGYLAVYREMLKRRATLVAR